MAISVATLTDVPELVTLVNSAYRGESSKKGWTTEANLIDGQRIDEEGLIEQMSDPNATILKNTDADGNITACVYLLKKPGNVLYLGMLTVSPTLQAHGIGRQLLAAAEDYARSINHHTVAMTVITTRTELLNWYERRGYTKTGETIPLIITERNGILKQPVEMFKLHKAV
ncbi:GNAT family N-acetyltransferase [Inquilinus sp. KBS0705]|nr:GNAT family N-acetyltransferase [Inquilinus sp. KBS0705]